MNIGLMRAALADYVRLPIRSPFQYVERGDATTSVRYNGVCFLIFPPTSVTVKDATIIATTSTHVMWRINADFNAI